MNLWQQCQGEQHLQTLQGTLFRLVESQEQVATLGYVDNLAEQALLEQMLEDVKPPSPLDASGLHYLLRTPFRYPPLPWGSRFGSVHEPSLFYGALDTPTALAETAYYRLLFWHSMVAPAPKTQLRTQHTLFSVGYRSGRAVALHQPPFAAHEALLRHRSHYHACQQLGAAMRASAVELFEYRSARAPAGGLCVALFSPSPFLQKRPRNSARWFCEVTAEQVTFKALQADQLIHFAARDFLVDGELPHPA
ncbi:RES family NAD+ phosphorylase [Isoalcanivorax beigongshangi]|uniref:RES family NAD+ phosphorylase n=1 Tax=Isoalcanivorax beigongshangi TaxID=3238810 RepID=A0ABV4AHE6_9GAMM